MSKRTKDLFTVEVLAMVFSLVPLALLWLLPNMLDELVNEEMEQFIGMLTLYMVYPLCALLISFMCAWFNMDWYIAILTIPSAFFLAAITYFPSSLLDLIVYIPAYALIGAVAAWPVSRYKKRKSEDDKYLGRRL